MISSVLRAGAAATAALAACLCAGSAQAQDTAPSSTATTVIKAARKAHPIMRAFEKFGRIVHIICQANGSHVPNSAGSLPAIFR